MRRLIQPNFASAGKSDVRQSPPRCLLHIGATDILLVERGDHRIKVVAHQIKYSAEQIVTSVLLREVTVHRVNGGFRGRNSENHPSVAYIYKGKPQDVAEERAIGFGILAVEQEMGTDDHAAEYISRSGARV